LTNKNVPVLFGTEEEALAASRASSVRNKHRASSTWVCAAVFGLQQNGYLAAVVNRKNRHLDANGQVFRFLGMQLIAVQEAS
jgi:hypothetical protein